MRIFEGDEIVAALERARLHGDPPAAVGDGSVRGRPARYIAIGRSDDGSAAEPRSPLPSRPSAVSGKTSTVTRPAAMKPAEVAASIRPRSWPIAVAATMNGSEVACSSAAAPTRRRVELAAIEQRRQAAGDEQRGDEGRDRGDRGRRGEERVEVEADPAGDEEDRDEDAEADRRELQPKLGMGHAPVLVEVVEDRAGGERAEDQLEAELLGERDHPDQEHERAAHADLGAGVLKADERRRRSAERSASSHADRHRSDHEHEGADQDELRRRSRSTRRRTAGSAAEPRRSRRSRQRRSPAGRTATRSRPSPGAPGRSPRARSRRG